MDKVSQEGHRQRRKWLQFQRRCETSTRRQEGRSLLYLHHDFEPVQRGGAGPGNGSSSSTRDQVPPPHARLLLLDGELIRDHQVLAHVNDLPDRDTTLRIREKMDLNDRKEHILTGTTKTSKENIIH